MLSFESDPAAAQLRQLEQLCGGQLPSDYLDQIIDYPAVLTTTLRSADDPNDGMVSSVEFLADLEDVVEINREARSEAIQAPDGTEFSWPTGLLVIGETGDGDYFCLDTHREVTGVIQYRHRTLDFLVLTDSVQEFVGMLIEAYVNSDGDPEDGTLCEDIDCEADEDEEDE